MAQKKKTIDFGFTPSEYQQKIFDFVTNGVGNAVISAMAGSGKTTSLVSAMKLIPSNQKCIFLAFNKSIAEELANKLTDLTNVRVRTSHSLGYAFLMRNLGKTFELDEYKYNTYVKKNISELSSVNDKIKTKADFNEYLATILTLVHFARFNYCQTVKEIDQIALKYSIPIVYDECDVVLKVLKWGKENTATVDYTDMVWLPVECNMNPKGMQYDWVFIDEAQDQSVISIELFKKCFKRGTRFIAVGDPSQQIYTWAGSSEYAFNKMCNLPNTKIFTLPISYRCDKKIVESVHDLVPDIMAREDAGEGEVNENCNTWLLKDGDMVLSRSKAPLMKLYTKLLKRNIRCYIKGQDIAKNLITLIENVDKEELSVDLKKNGLFPQLYLKLFNDRNKLMQTRGLDYDDATCASSVLTLYDNITTLSILAEKCKYKHELIKRIKTIFAEESDGICLSTIHKAKGLEADNVYILCRSTMPSKKAKLEWEIKQEENLIYVAYTRAKHKLGLLSEKECPPCGADQEASDIINELMYIENKISKFLNFEPTVRMSHADIAKFNLKDVKEIPEEDVKKKNVVYKSINKEKKKLEEQIKELTKRLEELNKQV